ncbi:hypothetical protein P3X46_005847 [Hevea brasiliensis]|uniref:DNA replication complex GINS protein SLD5 n=1 Tax=Hevea brasiliensis TaxID=3981 RepID=A0ABQ9MN96_HEVBR|nr:DNA replication complex GINS protein SLD5 [Hevea brasiliensis]KAJ9181789.1 hypothetical protein P3X46_005847 [Hevea brasiliensis]
MATGSGEESTSAIMDDYETLISTTDVELLKRAWRNEKAAPEILQYESSLVQRIKEQIELAEQNVEMFEADSIDPLTVSLYQMDLDRTQFLLRSYLRVRLQKIEEYLFHILKTDEYLNRLSKQEQMFARRCTDDLGNHLDETVLSKLPDNYQSILKQSITSEEDDMVPVPRLDTFIICKAKQYLSSIDFEPEYSTEITEMERDLLTFVCYKFIKRPLEKGKIDLV